MSGATFVHSCTLVLVVQLSDVIDTFTSSRGGQRCQARNHYFLDFCQNFGRQSHCCGGFALCYGIAIL